MFKFQEKQVIMDSERGVTEYKTNLALANF